jgi:hypothetical protein
MVGDIDLKNRSSFSPVSGLDFRFEIWCDQFAFASQELGGRRRHILGNGTTLRLKDTLRKPVS